MNSLRNLGLMEIFQLAMISLAYGVFCYFSIQSFHDFQEQRTGINQFWTPVEELPLPTITICSQDVFKNVISDELTSNMLLQNLSNHVYSREDFFHKAFLKDFLYWNPHEIFSSMLGLCFSVKLRMNVTEATQNHHWLKLPAYKEFQVWNDKIHYLDT